MAAWVARAPVAVWHRPGDRVGPPSRRRHGRPETRRRCDTSGALDLAAAAARARPAVDLYDLSDTLTEYSTAWEWQRAILDLRLRHLARDDADDAMLEEANDDDDDDAPLGSRDVVLMVQHPPVVTLGTGSTAANLKFDPDAPDAPFPVHRTERGGEATYHGPGQLVIYPIINLQDGHHRPDLHWYMRSLEDVALATMESLGVARPGRVDGLTGAWANVNASPPGAESHRESHGTPDGTPDGTSAPGDIAGREHKLAAIGVRARRWVTYHGMALNVDPNLQHFRAIVPCGIGNRPVGSVAQMLGGRPGVVSALDDGSLDAAFEGFEGEFIDGTRWPGADDALMRAARTAATDAFERVFRVRLRPRRGAPDVTAVCGGDGSGR